MKTTELETLFNSNYERLIAYAKSIVGSMEDAEDAVSHSFIKVKLKFSNEEKSLESPISYIKTIIKNACIDEIRRRRKHSDLMVYHEPEQQVYHNKENLLEKYLKRDQNNRCLLDDIIDTAELSYTSNTLVQLRREGKTNVEISELLGTGISNKQVGQRFGKAMEKLREAGKKVRRQNNDL